MTDRIERTARAMHSADQKMHREIGAFVEGWDQIGARERDDYRRRAAAEVNITDAALGGAGRGTHTYAVLDISPACFREISAKLFAIGRGGALHNDPDGLLADMHGVTLRTVETVGEWEPNVADDDEDPAAPIPAPAVA